jgi:predicted phosphodiesterase
MRIAVIADIHGNALALEAVRADIARRNVERIVNLGDCVSGPLWPRETVEALITAQWPTVRGNHDRCVGEDPPGSLGLSDGYAHRALDAPQRLWLRALPARLDFGDGLIAFHARPGNDEAYLLEDVEGGRMLRAPPESIAERLAGVTATIMLCGHSHLPRALRLPDGRWVVNPGSVGCPAYDSPAPPAHVSESGAPSARYAVLEREGDRVAVDLIAIAYDHEAAARRAEDNGRADWVHALRTGFMPPKR